MNIRVKWKAITQYLLTNKSPTQTILKNTFWLTASNFGARLIRAGLIIYVARILGAAGYGVFSYALSLAAFFAVFSDIGITGILTREAAKDPRQLPRYLSTTFFIKIIQLAVSVALIWYIAPLFSNIPEAAALIPLAALLLASDSLRDFALSITRANEHMQVEAGVNIVTNLAIFGIGVAALLIHGTPLTFMLAYAAGSACGTLLIFWIMRKHFVNWSRQIEWKLIPSIIGEAWPFALLVFLSTILFSTDTIALGWLTNAREVGIYSAAQRVVQFFYIIPSILAMTFFPSFARFAAENSDRFRRVMEQAVASCLLIAAPIALGGMAIAQHLMLFLFGAEYSTATASFMILMGTILVYFPSTFLGNAVFAHGKQKSFVMFMAAGALINLALDLLLIPHFGGVGCAIATLTAEVIANLLMWRKLKSIAYFETVPHLKNVAIAGVAMTVIAFVLDRAGAHILTTVVLSALTYGGLLYMLKEPLLARIHPRFVAR